jgi:hypothetical protein
MICDTAAVGGGLAFRTVAQRALISHRDATIVMTKR